MRTRRRPPLDVPPQAPPVRRRRRALKPLPFTDGEIDPQLPEIRYGDGYRGDQGIQWRGAAVVECAVQCRCTRWWGWYPERAAVGLRAVMRKEGCTRCQ